MSHDLFLTRDEIASNLKTAVQYPTSLLAGTAYRAAQVYHGVNRPTQQTIQRGDFDLTWKKNAHLAKAAYTSSPVEGYTIDPEFSNENTTVYKDNQTGKATVAFSGTRGVKDAKADLAIFAGMEQKDPQFQQALQTTKNVISKYGKDNVSVTGHSLGGTKTSYVSSKLGVKGTTYNQGWFGGAITHATNVGDKWDASKVKDYVVPGDLISKTTMITPGRNVTKIPQEEKLSKLKDMFKMKGMETMARTSIPEMVAPIPYVGQAAALAYVGYGTYELGKRLYDLHKMDNFITPVTPRKAPKNAAIHSGGHSVGGATATNNDDIKSVKPEMGVRPDTIAEKERIPKTTHPVDDGRRVYASDSSQRAYGVFPAGTNHPFYSYGFGQRPRQRRHEKRGRAVRHIQTRGKVPGLGGLPQGVRGMAARSVPSAS